MNNLKYAFIILGIGVYILIKYSGMPIENSRTGYAVSAVKNNLATGLKDCIVRLSRGQSTDFRAVPNFQKNWEQF